MSTNKKSEAQITFLVLAEINRATIFFFQIRLNLNEIFVRERHIYYSSLDILKMLRAFI